MNRTTIDQRLDALETALVREALNRDWQHKFAKFGKAPQSLFVHAVNTFSVARTIGEKIFELTDDELFIACLAAFLHDYQKAKPRWQDAVARFMSGAKTSASDFSHDSGSDEDRQELYKLLERVEAHLDGAISLTDLTDRILNIVVYTHDSVNRAEAMRRKNEVGPIDPLARVVRLCDSIAGTKRAEDIVNRNKDPDIPPGKEISFEYHEIAVLRGIVSAMLNDAVIRLLEEYGYIPLLYFGNGAAYVRIGTGKEVPNPRERVMEILEDKFREFQDSDLYRRGMTNAVLGNITQTKWPGIHLVRQQDVRLLFERIASMNLANKPEKEGAAYYQKALDEKKPEKRKTDIDALDKFVKLIGTSSRDAILAEMISDFNILIYFADFLKSYSNFADGDLHQQYVSDVDQWMADYAVHLTFNDLSDVSNTTPPSKRVEKIIALWDVGGRDLHRQKDRRKTIVDSFVSVVEKVVEKYGKYAPPLISPIAKDQLLADIHHLPPEVRLAEDYRKLSKEMFDRYVDGKAAKQRLCNLCGFIGDTDAIAGIFGDGAEKFTNFRPGGAKIGKGNKAQVCPLCLLEGTLRGFYFSSSPYGTIYILPDLSLSPAMQTLWTQAINRMIRGERVGLSIGRSWNMREVYENLAMGNMIDNAEHLMTLLTPTKNDLKELAEYLEETFDSPNDVVYAPAGALPDDIDFKEMADAHLRGKIQIDEDYLDEYTPSSRFQSSSYFTPSYSMVFLSTPPRDVKEESPSTSAMRIYLLSLILADLYHARVVFVEGYQPLEQFEITGRVNVQMPPPAALALQNLGIGSTVSTAEIKSAIQKLSALVLVSLLHVKKLGKDRLIRLASMNRGAILRRAEMETSAEKSKAAQKWKGYNTFRLVYILENLPAKAGNL